MESAFITAAVIGFVEFVNRAFARDWKAVVIIFGAAVIGLVAGLLHVNGIDWPNGIVLGLSASGIVTVATRIG